MQYETDKNGFSMYRFKSNCPEFKTRIKRDNLKKVRVMKSSDIIPFLREIWEEEKLDLIESFYVVFLNRANTTVGWSKISDGGITGTVADPKIIYNNALQSLACNMIIAHNHPSGNLRPSNTDEELTKKIAAAGKLLDIHLLDHIILTTESHFSFADEGYL